MLCLCFDTTITIYHHLSMISFVWTKTFINTTQDHASYNVHKIQAWTNYQKHSVNYKGVSIWNNLAKSVKEIKTFSLFRKTKIKSFSPQARKLELFHYANLFTWMFNLSLKTQLYPFYNLNPRMYKGAGGWVTLPLKFFWVSS